MKTKKVPVARKNAVATAAMTRFPVVGIGASAGGLDAFKKLLKAIPENSGMAYVLVQHLDPNHESFLPELLQKVTALSVQEVTHGIHVERNQIYVIPSNHMMVASQSALHLSLKLTKNRNTRNLPINLFFTSLAEVYGTWAIGVILSGTATDGTIGLRAIKEHGGITFAQDEESANYSSMPKSAVQAGVVDFVLPPERIPGKLVALLKRKDELQSPTKISLADDFFHQIILLLRTRRGADFTYYKKSTVQRRILRRMAIVKCSKSVDYLRFIRGNQVEQEQLFNDLLIPVTSFFRDPKSFDDLKTIAFPTLLKKSKQEGRGDTLRVWIAGCSTGQEAYSIAIALIEYGKRDPRPFQLFATDINEAAIAKARLGIYSAKETAKLPARFLKSYFVKKDDGFQIIKSIRDQCVFAVHNFLKDPPFSKIDLVSCRNVFIYLEPYLQKKALITFHYALQEKGMLMLGKTETIGTVSDLFSLIKKSACLFQRRNVPTRTTQYTPRVLANPTGAFPNSPELPKTDYQKAADDLVLRKYTPVGVVVNEMLEVVYFRGSTRNYLELASGKPTHQLLKMAKTDLTLDLRNLLYKARKTQKAVVKEGVKFKTEGRNALVRIEVIPLPNTAEVHYLVLFHEANVAQAVKLTKGEKSRLNQRSQQVDQLTQELEQTYEDMRTITSEQEAANEELQIANEELLSSSEESQSLNEELETSKEELQSTNEELVVVNQELVNLNEHLTEAKEYAEGIIATIREPLLVLDRNLRVKTANQSYYLFFDTDTSQTEGKLLFELDEGQWNVPDLRRMLETVLPQKSVFNDFEIQYKRPHGVTRILLLNARALLRANRAQKLILLAFKDVTDRKNHEAQVRESLSRFQNLVAQAPVSICIIKKDDYQVELANEAYLQMIKRGREFIGKPIFESMPELLAQGFKEILDDVLKTGVPFSAKELEVPFIKNGVLHTGYYSFNYQPLIAPDGSIDGVIATGYEVTEQVISKRVAASNQLLRERDLEEKVQQRTADLNHVNDLLRRENKEKEKRAEELVIANQLLAFENSEKQKRGTELVVANQELESFTYIASHDLQEPLRKIQTFSKRIMEKEVANLSEGGKDYFLRMERAANRMQVLIEDLLLYSRTNSKVQEFENVNLNTITDDVILDFKDQINEKGATITVAQLGTARVVPFQFQQLFQNLIGNALKFFSHDRALHIQIKAACEENSTYLAANEALGPEQLVDGQSYLHLSITDNGIGFEQRFHDQIFQLFQRLHAREKYTGTGIGLSIVRKITDNHHGFITARGEVNKGAIFDVYIPR